MMSFRERMLYHQIHPAKLATDIGVTAPAGYLLWEHKLGAAVAVSLGPPLIVSGVILLCKVNLEHYKSSKLGQYVARYMTHTVEAIRLLGFLVMAVGCWFHEIWLVPTGIAVVGLAWLRGLL
jgi:hypothetical protein